MALNFDAMIPSASHTRGECAAPLYTDQLPSVFQLLEAADPESTDARVRTVSHMTMWRHSAR